MKCPACSNELSIKTVGNIELDTCDNGCGGIWFDQFELKKFDEASEPDPESVSPSQYHARGAAEDSAHLPEVPIAENDAPLCEC